METQQNGPKITKSENSITIDGISVPKNADASITNEDGKWIVSFAPKKEEPIFKEGDIVTTECEYGKWVSIIKKIRENSIEFYFSLEIQDDSFSLSKEGIIFSPDFRFSTKDEKHTLLVKMLEKNMFWDDENKKVQTIKNGDVLYIKTICNINYYSVFKGITSEYKFGLVDVKNIVDHFGMNASDGLVYINNSGLCEINEVSSVHFLSKVSTDFLFQELARQKKLWWNGDKKKLEKYRFRESKGQKYWYIDSEADVDYAFDSGGDISNIRFKIGNYFETKEEAELAAPKVKELYNKIWNIS